MTSRGKVETSPDVSPVRLDLVLGVERPVIESLAVPLLVHVVLVLVQVTLLLALFALTLLYAFLLVHISPPDEVVVDLVNQSMSDAHAYLKSLLAQDSILVWHN